MGYTFVGMSLIYLHDSMQVFMHSFFVLKRSKTVMDLASVFASSLFLCFSRRFLSNVSGTSFPFHFANDSIALIQR